jgi:RsiW-degrading membrane proteinase PrsW (M82 family)
MGNDLQNKKTKPLFKVVAAVLTALGLFIVVTAGQMAPPVFALGFLASACGWGFLLYTYNKELPDGLPPIVRIAGAFLLAIYFLGMLAEALTGFAIDGYTYHTIPDVDIPWINTAIALLFFGIAGTGVLLREKLGDWFYE